MLCIVFFHFLQQCCREHAEKITQHKQNSKLYPKIEHVHVGFCSTLH